MEIRCQFIILARKDKPTRDYAKRRTDTGLPPATRSSSRTEVLDEVAVRGRFSDVRPRRQATAPMTGQICGSCLASHTPVRETGQAGWWPDVRSSLVLLLSGWAANVQARQLPGQPGG